MPINSNPFGIVGTDGFQPDYRPDDRWCVWAIHEIYTGGDALNRYVPKVRDYVYDTDTFKSYKVIEVDPTTLIAKLKEIVNANVSQEFTEDDLLTAVGPGHPAETFRVYINKNVTPHTLAVDARCWVPAVEASFCKIFVGSVLTSNERVISAQYDQQGQLLSQNIPLRLAARGHRTALRNGIAIDENISIRVPEVCYTTEDLKDGDTVTLVVYSDAGHVLHKRKLIVENSGFIRSPDQYQKYVTGITLETPFMSETNPDLVLIRLGVPMSGFNLFGVVHYSDGSSNRLPVDGTKFELFGLENYVATIINQPVDLLLKYNLGPSEIAYGATIGTERFYTRKYAAKTVQAEGNFVVKLFGYPVWIDETNGYRLEWFLCNLERRTFYRVTNLVKLGSNSPALNPTAYGVLQQLSFNISLREVNGIYRNYIHTQTVDIVLNRPGDDLGETRWSIGFNPGQNPPFGRKNRANMRHVNQNLKILNLTNQEPNLTTWLERMYYLTFPLSNPAFETRAPEPNMFSVIVADQEFQFTIENWNADLEIPYLMDSNDTVFIKFFKRTPESDLVLSVAGLPVYQIA